MPPQSPLFLQLVLILGTARFLSMVLRRLDQPPVIGEMTAGIVLGALLPEWHANVFEPSSLPALEGLSQVGLVLFMFIVGAELRAPEGARPQLVAAGWISIMSVLLPIVFGVAAAFALDARFAPEGAAFPTFTLFMAAARAPRRTLRAGWPPGGSIASGAADRHLRLRLRDQVAGRAPGIRRVPAWCRPAAVTIGCLQP